MTCMSHYLGWVQDITSLRGDLPFHRTQLVTTFMVLAVAVGVVHVLFGLVLGVINAVRTKNKKHLYEKGGILTCARGHCHRGRARLRVQPLGHVVDRWARSSSRSSPSADSSSRFAAAE